MSLSQSQTKALSVICPFTQARFSCQSSSRFQNIKSYTVHSLVLLSLPIHRKMITKQIKWEFLDKISSPLILIFISLFLMKSHRLQLMKPPLCWIHVVEESQVRSPNRFYSSLTKSTRKYPKYVSSGIYCYFMLDLKNHENGYLRERFVHKIMPSNQRKQKKILNTEKLGKLG